MFRPDFSPKTILFVSLLALFGVAGNYFKLQLFFNVDFLFGGFFVMTAVIRYGFFWGTLVGLVASTCTYMLWNHPYAIVIFTLEAAFVSWLRDKRGGSIVIYDTFYWALVGIPLVFIFYYLVMKVEIAGTVVIMSKQTVNGLFNALFASIIYNGYQHLRFKMKSTYRSVSYSQLLFETLSAALLIPVLFVMLYNIRLQIREQESDNKTTIIAITRAIARATNEFLKDNMKTIRYLIHLSDHNGKDPARISKFQGEIEDLHKVYDNFLRIGVLNSQFRTYAFSPEFNDEGKSNIGIDLSDREYLAPLRDGDPQEYVSDILVGRIFKRSDRIIVLAARNNEKGSARKYAVGSLNIASFHGWLKHFADETGTQITLLDRKRNIIISTNKAYQSGAKWVERSSIGQLNELGDDIRLWLPNLPENISLIKRWKDSIYTKEVMISKDIPWRVVVDLPLGKYVQLINEESSKTLFLMFALIYAAMGLASVFSRIIVNPIAGLSRDTSEITTKINKGLPLALPATFIKEINSLSDNFQSLFEQLSQYFREIQLRREALESQVYERTRELQASEEKYRSLSENMQDIIYRITLRPHIKVEFMNSAAESVTGYSPEDFYNDYSLILKIIHPEDRRALKSYLFMPKRERETIVFRWVRKDSKIVWIEHSDRFVKDEQERIVSVEGIGRDITARRLLAELFRENAKRFKMLFENAPDAMIIADTESGLIIDANHAAELLMGQKKTSLLGRHFSTLHPEEDKEHIVKEFENSKHRHAVVQVDVIKPDGIRVPVEIISNTFDFQGRLTQLGIFRDITERKRAEEKLRDSLKEKEVLIREVHHRVKNNLQVISSLINIQCNAINDESYKSVFIDLQNRIMAMSLVHETLYRSDTPTLVNFRRYMTDLISALVATYGRLGIDVMQSFDEIELNLETAINIGLIMNELIANAFKHAFPEERVGKVVVQLFKISEDTLKLSVSDNGIGFTGDRNLSRSDSLGLQLVHMLTRQLKGEIIIKNDNGTEVVITFRHLNSKGSV